MSETLTFHNRPKSWATTKVYLESVQIVATLSLARIHALVSTYNSAASTEVLLRSASSSFYHIPVIYCGIARWLVIQQGVIRWSTCWTVSAENQIRIVCNKSDLGDMLVSIIARQSCSFSASIKGKRVAGFKGGECFKDMWGLERMVSMYPERHAAVICWVAEVFKICNTEWGTCTTQCWPSTMG